VGRWLSQQSEHRHSLSLTGQLGQQYLHVRCQRSLSDDTTVLLLELIRSKSEERRRRDRQLTPRERQVLFWVSQSKTNQEIASILELAAATVGKHLERIYPKLGVENRAGATAYALENPTIVR
jgi:DNA-binding CsgD family transcriptional regulator